MQMVLRPVAVRALLLIAGVVLGLLAFLTAFAAVNSSASHSAAGTGTSTSVSDNGGHKVLAGGVRWL
jgi:hypothetical protein